MSAPPPAPKPLPASLRHSGAGRNPGDQQRPYAPNHPDGPPSPRPILVTPASPPPSRPRSPPPSYPRSPPPSYPRPLRHARARLLVIPALAAGISPRSAPKPLHASFPSFLRRQESRRPPPSLRASPPRRPTQPAPHPRHTRVSTSVIPAPRRGYLAAFSAQAASRLPLPSFLRRQESGRPPPSLRASPPRRLGQRGSRRRPPLGAGRSIAAR